MAYKPFQRDKKDKTEAVKIRKFLIYFLPYEQLNFAKGLAAFLY